MQAIDTGYCANPKTGVTADFAFTSATPTQQKVFGADVDTGQDPDNRCFSFSTYINGSGYYAWACCDGKGNWTPYDGNNTNPDAKADTRRRTVVLDSYNKVAKLLTGGAETASRAIGTTRTRTSPRTLAIFADNDGEMIGRLVNLYGEKRAAEVARQWEAMRRHGFGHLVDERKERFCRRMYNLSQFVKTLKERISMWYNEEYGHSGCLWQGRFYSGGVEKSAVVKAVVAAYVGYNPVKAKIAASPADWRWSSYAIAVNDQGPSGSYCRAMYEKMLGRPWEEVRAVLESMYADKLPDDVHPETLKEWLDDYDEKKGDSWTGAGMYRASQAIRATMRMFSGAYIGRDTDFLERVAGHLPKKFPRVGGRSIRRCRAFVWEAPQPELLNNAA